MYIPYIPKNDQTGIAATWMLVGDQMSIISKFLSDKKRFLHDMI
jgi:hypothetical protein